MNQRNVTLVILSSLVFGALGSWLFLRVVVPKLNTIPFLVKYNLAPSAGPLVINTRQEIHVNDGSDLIAAIQTAKPWIVGIVSGSDLSHASVAESGLILTSDGLVAALKSSLPAQPVLNFTDGTTAKATVIATDPGSDLVFLKVAGKNNLQTASFGTPKDLQLGQRLILLSADLGQYQASERISYLQSEWRDLSTTQTFSSDQVNQTILVGATDAPEGSVIVSSDAVVQGIYSKNGTVSADAIKSALNSYFNGGKIVRNVIGLHYQVITPALADIFTTKSGVIVRQISGATLTAGLVAGDVIYKVDGTQINFDNSFEELINKHHPGDTTHLTVWRAGADKNIDLVIAASK